MKIYLDTSVLNRIFDDQSQVRIYLEATVVLLIFMLIDKGYLELVSSEVLIYGMKTILMKKGSYL